MARRKTQTEPGNSEANGDGAPDSTGEASTQDRDREQEGDSRFQKLSEKKDRVFSDRHH
jgi:hypothetical protein